MFWFILTLCFVQHFVYGYVEINEEMKSFSHAIKGVFCHAGQEIELFEHSSGPGVITEQWYTGHGCFDNQTIVRYYIDGDATPTIEANVFMMHGIGLYDRNIPPWGTKWIGHTATDGGLYNTYRIPFQKSIRISFVSLKTARYWFIVRGVENYAVIIGDMTLPKNAKLVLHKIENMIFPPLSYVPLVSTKKSGIVFALALKGESPNFWWLEGCFGTVITDANNKTDVNFLSSGTEDFFLSAYYYNKGIYHTDDSGLTYIKAPGTMSAYKFFHSDPVVMRGKFSLLWRVSEKFNADNCWLPTDEEAINQPFKERKAFQTFTERLRFQDSEMERILRENENGFQPAKITSYVWTYEW